MVPLIKSRICSPERCNTRRPLNRLERDCPIGRVYRDQLIDRAHAALQDARNDVFPSPEKVEGYDLRWFHCWGPFMNRLRSKYSVAPTSHAHRLLGENGLRERGKIRNLRTVLRTRMDVLRSGQ
jgi:hypothetical protein